MKAKAAKLRTVRWLTNLRLLQSCDFWSAEAHVRQMETDNNSLWAALRLHIISLAYDVVVLYQPPKRLQWFLCGLRLVTIWKTPKLIFIDILFTRPNVGFRDQIRLLVKRILLKHVDLFIVFAKHVEPLTKYYGIDHGKYRYVPFKVNRLARARACSSSSEGEYVFSGGRSRRDFRTFCLAMKELGYPGVILTPRADEAEYHETFLDQSLVPDNVRVVYEDGVPESWIKWIEGSKSVVVCIISDSIIYAGVSTYLEAMGLGKCVIVTDSLGVRDILEDGNQALIVPEESPAALAAAIRKVWEDGVLRRGIAERGKAYALSLGGEAELVQRFVDAVEDHFGWSSNRMGSAT